jgi:hypothetical protein
MTKMFDALAFWCRNAALALLILATISAAGSVRADDSDEVTKCKNSYSGDQYNGCTAPGASCKDGRSNPGTCGDSPNRTNCTYIPAP